MNAVELMLTLSDARGVHQNRKRASRFTPIDFRAVYTPIIPIPPAGFKLLQVMAAGLIARIPPVTHNDGEARLA